MLNDLKRVNHVVVIHGISTNFWSSASPSLQLPICCRADCILRAASNLGSVHGKDVVRMNPCCLSPTYITVSERGDAVFSNQYLDNETHEEVVNHIATASGRPAEYNTKTNALYSLYGDDPKSSLRSQSTSLNAMTIEPSLVTGSSPRTNGTATCHSE